jgi:alpha-methylacyl-CoA racemase
VTQASPAPRYSRTAPVIGGPAPYPGQDTEQVLADLGLSREEISRAKSVSGP